jgi:multidrug efflux pump subunit AcrB
LFFNAAAVIEIYKQPGANVVSIVSNVQAALPRIMAAVPPAIKVDTVVDRTTTIRASVQDVEFTLMITFALVVMVIFVFLRSVSATIIPSVTVPLALVGTAAGMYLFGYSIDNLSLMGLGSRWGSWSTMLLLCSKTSIVHRRRCPGWKRRSGAGEIGCHL